MATVLEQRRDQLREVMATAGYAKITRFTMKDRGEFRLHFEGPSDGLFTWTCDLYARDAYPDKKGEAFLRVWSGIGMLAPKTAKRIAEAFVAAGITARATTNRGDTVVAFKKDLDWGALS